MSHLTSVTTIYICSTGIIELITKMNCEQCCKPVVPLDASWYQNIRQRVNQVMPKSNNHQSPILQYNQADHVRIDLDQFREQKAQLMREIHFKNQAFLSSISSKTLGQVYKFVDQRKRVVQAYQNSCLELFGLPKNNNNDKRYYTASEQTVLLEIPNDTLVLNGEKLSSLILEKIIILKHRLNHNRKRDPADLPNPELSNKVGQLETTGWYTTLEDSLDQQHNPTFARTRNTVDLFALLEQYFVQRNPRASLKRLQA
jgi:hypothetical protein